MGLFYFYKYGFKYANVFYLTGQTSSVSEVLLAYSRWWRQEFEDYVRGNLNRMLLCVGDDLDVVDEIMNFRTEFRLQQFSDVTLADIVRFKSLKIYTWLLLEFYQKFISLLGKDNIDNLKDLIEHCVIVGIDTACCLTDVMSDKDKYNEYTLCLVDSIITRLNSLTLYGITMSIQKQYVAATYIQRVWRNSYTNPKFYLCRRRILREFQEFQLEMEKKMRT
jgi:hypothetical protein